MSLQDIHRVFWDVKVHCNSLQRMIRSIETWQLSWLINCIIGTHLYSWIDCAAAKEDYAFQLPVVEEIIEAPSVKRHVMRMHLHRQGQYIHKTIFTKRVI